MAVTDSPTRPPLRYHGGKWKLAPWIISYFPEHRVYVEPFGGGASVLLRKPRSYGEVYNDLSGELVNLFASLRDRGEELSRAIELTPFARGEYDLSFERTNDALEQARRTLVRSRMGFGSNALCRSVKSGFRASCTRAGSTPAGDWRALPDTFPAIIERLRGVVLENRDAKEVMQKHDGPDTLHYCDPPYVHSTRMEINQSHRGYDHEMLDPEHRALADFLHTLVGAVVVSGYDCPLYTEIFAGWERVERQTLADHALTRTEVLWCRNVHREQLLGISEAS